VMLGMSDDVQCAAAGVTSHSGEKVSSRGTGPVTAVLNVNSPRVKIVSYHVEDD